MRPYRTDMPRSYAGHGGCSWYSRYLQPDQSQGKVACEKSSVSFFLSVSVHYMPHASGRDRSTRSLEDVSFVSLGFCLPLATDAQA